MKKRFLKTMALLCAAALTVGTLAGCNTDSADGKTETFKIWTSNATPLEEEQVAEFNETIGKENGIKIELTNYGGDYEKTVEMAIANGTPPDFFLVTGSLRAQVEKGNLFPLDELPDMEDFLKEYEADFLENKTSVDGKVYAVPGRKTLFAMLYNKDLFKAAGIVDENGEAKPPKTWDEVVEYAKILTNPQESTYGIMLPMKWTAFWGVEIVNPMNSVYGTSMYNRTEDKYDFSIYKDILGKLMQIKADKSFFPGPEGLDNDAARAQFATGRVGMKMGASWDVYVLNDQFPAECDWGVCPVPKMDIDGVDYNQHNGTECLLEVSSSVKDKDLNKVSLIYKWYFSDERIGELYEQALLIPAKTSVIEKYEVKVDKQGWKEFAEIAKIAEKSLPGWVPLKLEGEAYAAVFDKVWAGSLTIDKAIEQLNDTYNSAYQKGKENGDFDLESYMNIPVEKFDITLEGAN